MGTERCAIPGLVPNMGLCRGKKLAVGMVKHYGCVHLSHRVVLRSLKRTLCALVASLIASLALPPVPEVHSQPCTLLQGLYTFFFAYNKHSDSKF